MHIHSNSSLARAWLATVLLLASATIPAIASDPLKNISREISDLRRTVVSAEIWIAPRLLESRGEISEEVLQKVGCSYLAAGKQDLDPLLDILASAALVEDDHLEEQFDTYIAIYLATRSGAVIPLLLNKEFKNAPSLGKYNSKTPVIAKSGLEGELRAWAALRKSTKPRASCHK